MNIWPANYWAHWAIFVVIIIAFVLTLVMAFIYVERRGLGRLQARIGPNRCGPFGVIQPVADAIKVFVKEDIIPAMGDKWVHWFAPVVAFFPVLMVFAVIPLHEGHGLITDLNVGALYIVAISSIGVLGIFMAGWGSSNKYSLLGAMRAVAQTVSYEIPLVLSLVGVILITGSLSINEIVEAQTIPFFLLQPLGFLIFFIATIAEINRTPFDLMEAESEIVAGFHTEYSGMKFAMFYLTEYGHALIASVLVTTFFLSGWMGPGLPAILWFLIKVLLIFFVIFWIRSTIPRIRVDQLMGFAWKCLLPLALINLIITGLEVFAWEVVWGRGLPWWLLFVNIAIAIGLILLWAKLLGGGIRRSGLGIAKGMALTFKHLLRQPITTQYPEECLNYSRRTRGNDFIWVPEKCTGCTACARGCPAGAIEIATSKGEDKKVIVEKLNFDLGRCIFCGLCVEACPSGALFMDYSCEKASYRIGALTRTKKDLAVSAGRLSSGYANAELEGLLPEQTLLLYRGKRKKV